MIQVTSWQKFQHYKGRRPPWIKLYRDLLDRREWHALSGDAGKLLVECWLIAAEYDDGAIPLDLSALAWRLRRVDAANVAPLLQELAQQGFVTVSEALASELLALCKRSATPEEKRVEREIEQPQRVDVVGNSEPEPEPTREPPEWAKPQEFSRFDLLEHARRECGMGRWGRKEEATANSVLVSWYGEGKTPGEIFAAIHGARLLVDHGKVDWLAPKQPFGLQALRNTYMLANQGDGLAQRPFFDVAFEEYVREGATGPPSRTASTGPVNVSGILANLKAQGSRT